MPKPMKYSERNRALWLFGFSAAAIISKPITRKKGTPGTARKPYMVPGKPEAAAERLFKRGEQDQAGTVTAPTDC